MRYGLSIAALVLAGVMLLLGLGQRTFLAGPAEISYPVDIKADTGYAVIDGAEFSKVPGQANVVVRGSNSFIATGMTRDVAAWVAPFSHAQLRVDASGEKLLSALIAPATDDAPAEGEEAPELTTDPRGSDLWLEERAVADEGSDVEQETLRLPVALAADQSVIVASDGEQPVPSDVSLVWVQDRHTPWAGPLLVGGAVLALVGGILYLLAVDHDRRGLGPRRGRRGPLQGIRNMFGGRRSRSTSVAPAGRAPADAVSGTGAGPVGGSGSGSGSTGSGSGTAPMRATTARRRGRFALPAVGLTLAIGLTGCSADYWPQTGPRPTQEAPEVQSTSIAPVPVTDAQLNRIVKRVAAVANDADESLDAKTLEQRFTGAALAQRTANYKIRSEMADYAVVPPRITDQELDYELVQSTESWPRTVFVTVASEPGGKAAEGEGEASESASPSLALMLTQASPHENFLVSRVIALRGGISMPDAAPAEEGTAVLANDTQTLLMPPGEVGAAYAQLLQNGAEGEAAEAFDLETDTLLQNYGKARAETAQQQSDEKDQTMKFSVTARQSDENPLALSTGTGGAIVSTTVIEEQIVDSDGGRYKPQAKDAVTALSGLTGEQDKLIQEVAHQMLFYIPSKNSDQKIQLLGVTSELVGVRNQ